MSPRLMRVLARGLLAAMLLAVLAPAFSRALARTRVAGDWVELCSAQGLRWVQLTAEGPAARPLNADEPLHALDDCGHCVLSAERFAPLLPTPPQWPLAASAWAVPRHQATPSHAQVAPGPGARGPPAAELSA